ncbi:hypothetical protein HDU98_009970 [Podochytrium sp. JEL0797]|nr:hypothetical protein HDU98_009970 [Podochytrium sp. JEL0797]
MSSVPVIPPVTSAAPVAIVTSAVHIPSPTQAPVVPVQPTTTAQQIHTSQIPLPPIQPTTSPLSTQSKITTSTTTTTTVFTTTTTSFQIAPPSTTTGVPAIPFPVTSASSNPNNATSSGPSSGVVVGAAVGGTIAFLAIVGILAWSYKHKRANKPGMGLNTLARGTALNSTNGPLLVATQQREKKGFLPSQMLERSHSQKAKMGSAGEGGQGGGGVVGNQARGGDVVVGNQGVQGSTGFGVVGQVGNGGFDPNQHQVPPQQEAQVSQTYLEWQHQQYQQWYQWHQQNPQWQQEYHDGQDPNQNLSAEHYAGQYEGWVYDPQLQQWVQSNNAIVDSAPPSK